MTQWLTYVGSKHYSPAKFLAEARAIGISRRIPANIAKGMHFGDTVLLMDWRAGRPACFGEFRISRIFFEGEVQSKVVKELKDEDKIVEDHSGAPATVVHRECGDYLMGGGATVRDDVDIPELVEKAEKAHKDLAGEGGVKEGDEGSLWAMVGGELTREYFPPRTLEPAPKFTRGFMHMTDGMSFVDANPTETGIAPKPSSVVGVEQYSKSQMPARVRME